MTKQEMEAILEMAQKLVDHLPKEMSEQLTELILSAKKKQNPTAEVMKIMNLLSPHEDLQRLMREQINLQGEQKGTTRGSGSSAGESRSISAGGYGPLAGWPGSIPASKKWICPNRTCDEWVLVVQEGEDPPVCKIHKIEMVHTRKTKG